MANLGILNGAEFYLYDVEVYDKILYGKINFKPSQVSSITSKGYKILSNGFYGINRTELIKQFIKYLAKMDINVDSDSFLLNEVTDKRIKKEGTYVNDPHIFSSSASQYDAQSTNKNTTNTNAKKEVKVAKPILDIDIINKDNMYKTTLNLKDYNLGDGTKTLYAFTQPQLKDKIESYFKSFKLDYDVNLNLVKPTQDVGKVLIDVTLNKDKVIGEVDLSHVNLPNIKAEATTKQGLLDAIINQLKSQNLTGKLNWGKIIDNTKKVENKGGKKNMATMTKAGVKSFANKLAKIIPSIGFNEEEIESRVMAMIPNAISTDKTLAGDKVDLSFILPWDISDSLTKTDINKIAKEKDTLAKYIDVLDAKPWLYITDEIGDGIRIEVSIDVNFENSFYDEQDSESFELVSIDIPIQVEEENEDALPKDIATYLEHQGYDKDEDEMYNRDLICCSLSFSKVSSMHIQALITVKDKYLNDWDFPVIEKLLKPLMDKYKGDLWSDGIELELPIDIKAVQEVIKKVYNEDEYIRDICKKGNQHIVLYGQEVTTPVPNDIKNPLPTTTMDSIDVRNDFIAKVIQGSNCSLINMTNDEFAKDVKAFHTVKLKDLKNVDSVNLDFPNQKICIATITLNDATDSIIFNSNMNNEHQVKFNGKIGTIRMKVNKDSLVSISDIVSLIKEIRNADNKLKNKGDSTMYDIKDNAVMQEFIKRIVSRKEVKTHTLIDKDTKIPVSFTVQNNQFQQCEVYFYDHSNSIEFKVVMVPNVTFMEMQEEDKKLIDYLSEFQAEMDGMSVAITSTYQKRDISIVQELVNILNKLQKYQVSQKKETNNSEVKDEFKKVLLDNGLQIVLDNTNVIQGILNDEVDLVATIKKFPSKSITVEISKGCPFVDNDGIEMIKNDKFSYNDIGSSHNFKLKKFNLKTLDNFLKDISNAKNDIKQTNNTSSQNVGKGIQNSISYDVEVYDKRLCGILQVNGSTKSFYGPDRNDLIDQFIKHLSMQGIKTNNNSFILNNVVDKRIKKSVPYKNDPTILPNTPNTGVEDMGKVTPKAPASSSPVVNDIEPTDNGIDPKRKTEINYKASAVKDPDHKAQLDRMKAYVKKIADVVDADNDFTLRFLEEPKEFTKYKLPTVGVGLFYYGDKSIAELEQSPLYKKVYRGRGLSILRKFFKTTDQNGEKCLLVLFVDAQYAKQTKAKLIKESFEQNTKISINGRQYTIKAIYEDKFAIETIVGAMYIDMDSELIDLTINEE